MTGYDFDVLLAVAETLTPPADGRKPPSHATLAMILGARYSGEPFQRGPEWEEVIEAPFTQTHYQRTVESLNRLRKLGLIRQLPTPDDARSRAETEAIGATDRTWLHSASHAKLTLLGEIMLHAGDVKVPPR